MASVAVTDFGNTLYTCLPGWLAGWLAGWLRTGLLAVPLSLFSLLRGAGRSGFGAREFPRKFNQPAVIGTGSKVSTNFLAASCDLSWNYFYGNSVLSLYLPSSCVDLPKFLCGNSDSAFVEARIDLESICSIVRYLFNNCRPKRSGWIISCGSFSVSVK